MVSVKSRPAWPGAGMLALWKVRKRLWDQARRGGDGYAVLKNPGDLTDRQSATLDAIRNTGPRGQLYRA